MVLVRWSSVGTGRLGRFSQLQWSMAGSRAYPAFRAARAGPALPLARRARGATRTRRSLNAGTVRRGRSSRQEANSPRVSCGRCPVHRPWPAWLPGTTTTMVAPRPGDGTDAHGPGKPYVSTRAGCRASRETCAHSLGHPFRPPSRLSVQSQASGPMAAGRRISLFRAATIRGSHPRDYRRCLVRRLRRAPLSAQRSTVGTDNGGRSNPTRCAPASPSAVCHAYHARRAWLLARGAPATPRKPS